jgi:hypothetical protein
LAVGVESIGTRTVGDARADIGKKSQPCEGAPTAGRWPIDSGAPQSSIGTTRIRPAPVSGGHHFSDLSARQGGCGVTIDDVPVLMCWGAGVNLGSRTGFWKPVRISNVKSLTRETSDTALSSSGSDSGSEHDTQVSRLLRGERPSAFSAKG